MPGQGQDRGTHEVSGEAGGVGRSGGGGLPVVGRPRTGGLPGWGDRVRVGYRAGDRARWQVGGRTGERMGAPGRLAGAGERVGAVSRSSGGRVRAASRDRPTKYGWSPGRATEYARPPRCGTTGYGRPPGIGDRM